MNTSNMGAKISVEINAADIGISQIVMGMITNVNFALFVKVGENLVGIYSFHLSYQNFLYPIDQTCERFYINSFTDEQSVSPPSNGNSDLDARHSGKKEGT